MRQGQLMNLTRINYRIIAVIAVLISGVMLSACGSGEDATPPEDTALQTTTSPVPGRTGTSTPGTLRSTQPDATTTADSGNIEVTPKEVAMGNIVLTLSVQPPQPVFDPGRGTSSSTGGDDQTTPTPQRGFVVLGGSTLKITNNFDGAQNPPADTPKEMLRHVAVQIRDKASGQLIPYAVVSMDLLRDGRSTLQDQALVPMLQAGADVSQMHYGNNVKFPGRGEYQIFVRMEPSPLLGQGTSGVAQFNVSIK